MANDRHIGAVWGNDTILWFIILFLLLFWNRGRFGVGGFV